MKGASSSQCPSFEELLKSIRMGQLDAQNSAIYRRAVKESNSPTWGNVWILIEEKLQAFGLVFPSDNKQQEIVISYATKIVSRKCFQLQGRHIKGCLTEILRNEFK